MTPARTLPRLFEDSVDRFPDNVLMWEKRGDAYEPLTYAAMRPLVHRFAAGLLGLGLGPRRGGKHHYETGGDSRQTHRGRKRRIRGEKRAGLPGRSIRKRRGLGVLSIRRQAIFRGPHYIKRF